MILKKTNEEKLNFLLVKNELCFTHVTYDMKITTLYIINIYLNSFLKFLEN